MRVLRPQIKEGKPNYSVFRTERSNFLIPLEVMYRNCLPKGSSIFRRLEKGDRYLDWHAAQQIAGLSDEETTNIKRITLEVEGFITSQAKKAGLKNEDGKIELAFGPNREIMLVDTAGTPDECRFSVNGIPLSKEVAREFYRKTNWYKAVQYAKEETRGGDWKKLVTENPPKLDVEMIEAISNLYMACANALTSRRWFDVPRWKTF